MAFVLIKSGTTLTRMFSWFPLQKNTVFELLSTPFRVRDAFSFEPFIHQTRFQTIAAEVYRVVQEVRVLKRKK